MERSRAVGRRAGESVVVGTGLLALSLLLAPRPAPAQGLSFRFVGADMYGGVVLPQDLEMGVAFGTRIGLLEIPARSLRIGLAIDWWAADFESGRGDADFDVRDIVAGVDAWKELVSAGGFRPFVGLGTAIHSLDTSGSERSILDGGSSEAERRDGFRVGASAYAGTGVRLTGTGAIWMVVEYRYNLVSVVSNHEIRAGIRLLTPGG